MLRVVTLSTLFPNKVQPSFGVFVETQTSTLAMRHDVELRVINPIAMPPFPLHFQAKYKRLKALPTEELWKGIRVIRPRFPVLPGVSGSLNPASLVNVVRPILRRWYDDGFHFDVIEAEFFYPDGPAVCRLAGEFGVPFLIKGRGADIHYWGKRPDCRNQILSAADRAGIILAVSKSLREDMIRLGMREDKIAVHYTGVDFDLFCPLHETERQRLRQEFNVAGPLVVSLGALIPRKGHDLVIEAMALINDATLFVIGDGPLNSALESLVKARGLRNRVRLLGNIPHPQLPRFLASADVMALASKSEGLANAWVEALACGTPIVIPDIDGAKEVMQRQTGRMVHARTPETIAHAIKGVLANPPPREEVRRAVECFRWERNTSELYRHLAALRLSVAANTFHDTTPET